MRSKFNLDLWIDVLVHWLWLYLSSIYMYIANEAIGASYKGSNVIKRPKSGLGKAM